MDRLRSKSSRTFKEVPGPRAGKVQIAPRLLVREIEWRNRQWCARVARCGQAAVLHSRAALAPVTPCTPCAQVVPRRIDPSVGVPGPIGRASPGSISPVERVTRISVGAANPAMHEAGMANDPYSIGGSVSREPLARDNRKNGHHHKYGFAHHTPSFLHPPKGTDHATSRHPECNNAPAHYAQFSSDSRFTAAIRVVEFLS
jgi:hypothetical protein